MPLPPALLERLKKRGIVPPKNREQEQEEEEEVIAEDHDDGSSDESDSSDGEDGKQLSLRLTKKKCKPMNSVTGCPNKVNIYHDCTEYCEERYGKGKVCPSPRTERKYRTLLKRFPLPLNWLDVWEPGTARYYFWNTETDEVSWLPPLHPKAKISQPVSRLRENIRPQTEDGSSATSSEDSEDDSEFDRSDSESDDNEPESKRRALGEPRRDGWYKRPIHPSRQPIQRNDLDPMDPASYSESCPRGIWSDGLSRDRDE